MTTCTSKPDFVSMLARSEALAAAIPPVTPSTHVPAAILEKRRPLQVVIGRLQLLPAAGLLDPAGILLRDRGSAWRWPVVTDLALSYLAQGARDRLLRTRFYHVLCADIIFLARLAAITTSVYLLSP